MSERVESPKTSASSGAVSVELGAVTAPDRAATESLSVSTIAAFAAPIFGLSAPFFFVIFYYFKFATDVLGIAPVVFGAIFALGRTWDAFSDPIAGLLSDRTNTRLGRRRPWMLAGIPLFAGAILMCWNPPETLSGTGLIVFVSVALFLFFTAYTIYAVPHQALGAELSEDHHECSRVFGARHVSFMIGMMGAFGFMHVASTAEDTRAAVSELAIFAAVGASLLLLIPATRVPERVSHVGRGGSSPWNTLRDVWRNRHARLLISVWFIESLGVGILGVMSPFHIEYVLGRKDLTAILPAGFIVTLVLAVPFWVAVSKRIGKRDAWRAAMVIGALGFGATFFAGQNDVWIMAVPLVIAGFAFGCGGAVGPSILADVIDYDEYETGERKEGAYSAAHGLALKLASALIVALAGVVLQASGFEPNVEQTERTKWVLRSVYAGLPFTMLLLAAFIFKRFTLTAEEHARIRTELDQRDVPGRSRGARHL